MVWLRFSYTAPMDMKAVRTVPLGAHFMLLNKYMGMVGVLVTCPQFMVIINYYTETFDVNGSILIRHFLNQSLKFKLVVRIWVYGIPNRGAVSNPGSHAISLAIVFAFNVIHPLGHGQQEQVMVLVLQLL